MIIHVIRAPATPEQIAEMLQAFGDFIKLAVDVDREILAGGGNLHADCENMLLQDGSGQENIWGADWVPVGFRMTRKYVLILSSISVPIRTTPR